MKNQFKQRKKVVVYLDYENGWTVNNLNNHSQNEIGKTLYDSQDITSSGREMCISWLRKKGYLYKVIKPLIWLEGQDRPDSQYVV